MFNRQDIPINSTVCGWSKSGLTYLAQGTKAMFERLAAGDGVVFRFRLTSTLDAGGFANCEILVYDGSGYSMQRMGIVHDEEPGGKWSGIAGDEGWCTGRDRQDDDFSIIWMDESSSSSSRQVMSFDYPTSAFTPLVTGEQDDIPNPTTIRSTAGNHSGLEYVAGERWQLETGTNIITDLDGGNSVVSVSSGMFVDTEGPGSEGRAEMFLLVRDSSSDPWSSGNFLLTLMFAWSNPVISTPTYDWHGYDRYFITNAVAGSQYKLVVGSSYTGLAPLSITSVLPAVTFETI
jgi:hypothetical protein